MRWWINPCALLQPHFLPKRAVELRHQLRAARLGYLLPAALIALWAAQIPYLQAALQLNHAQVGTLVFYFGAGSIGGMVLASPLTKAWGSRATCSLAAVGALLTIVLIALQPSFHLACILAGGFAMAAGLLEVAINIYGVSLERKYQLNLITPLHAYYSAGELFGAGCCLIFLNLGLTPLSATLCFATLLLICALRYFPCISSSNFKACTERAYMLPNLTVACLCLIVFVTYMVGGAMVDWSGVYLASNSTLTLQHAVCGYALVSAAMLFMRISGNWLLRRVGALYLVTGGAAILASGLVVVSLRPPLALMLLGFGLIGCGMANITPLSYRAAARQQDMPLLPTVAAMSIAGYGGLLCGPALLGFIAYYFNLQAVFAMLSVAVLSCLICMLHLRRHYH